MFGRQYILLFVLLVFTFQGWTQDDIVDPVLIRIHAQIISAADSTPVPYANIINNRTHSGTITNQEGYFTLEMLNIDSLDVTSVGFMKFVVKVPSNYSGQDMLVFKMLPVNYALREVQVKGDKPKVDLGLGTGKPTDIAPELRGDAFNDSPLDFSCFF